MKAVIFAGGFGTRISEETAVKPKPMVEIGGMPILWHIMKTYSHYGVNDFIICCGYKHEVIKRFFYDYMMLYNDLTFNLERKTTTINRDVAEKWNITLADTGLETMTGGRLKRVAKYLDDNEDFCLTYGDGLIDADISAVINYHKKHAKMATLTSARPPSRFGVLHIENNIVKQFQEKPVGLDSSSVNAGYFVLNKKVIDYIDGDKTTWEEEPLQKLSQLEELVSYSHSGFWQPMDTLKDKNYLNSLWEKGEAPWKVWTD